MNDGDRIQCPKCDYTTENWNYFVAHKRSKHPDPESKIKCEKCDFSHIYPSKMKVHYNIVHLGIKRQDQKNTCKKDSCESFGRNTCQDLETHSLFSCQQCHYLTRRKGEFQSHIQSVHEGIIYQCQHCYFVTKVEDLLKRHTKFEHSKMLFACTEVTCSYETVSNNLLKEHIGSKHGKPHKCDQCDYASFKLGDLGKHLKLHSALCVRLNRKWEIGIFPPQHPFSPGIIISDRIFGDFLLPSFTFDIFLRTS